MKLGRIPLVVAGVLGFGGLLAPHVAVAQPVVDTFFNFAWERIAQGVCLERGAAAINEAIAAFDLKEATTRQTDWFALGDAGDPVMLVFCVADDETENLVAPDAKRVLVNISVNGTNTALIEEIRDFINACMGGACPTAVPTGPQTIAWNANAANYRGQNGALIDFVCPAMAGGDVVGFVWGTDIYTDDSSICQAAAHAGIIQPGIGGPVTIEILPGQASYAGTIRNGIETLSYPRFDGSFRVVVGG